MHLAATPDTCFWGYLDGEQPDTITVESGTELTIEAITHHAGDAPDLLMDDGIRAIWDGIPEATRTPGVHIMTGPINVRGADVGSTLKVELLAMKPRLPYGSNCAANWGLCYDTFQKERITIYELVDMPADGSFPNTARPAFAFDFTTLELYDIPGVITPPDPAARQPFGRSVSVPVRPHLGVMGVAPEGERRSSIPPGVWGGNVDNWRFGPGAAVHYPVFREGAGFYVGDPHFAQGDGEICGTAIEASLDVTLRLSVVDDVPVTSPLLRTPSHWFTHGFGDDLGGAMRMAADQMLRFLVDRGGYSMDEAYSLASVAVDLGVTQVVDGVVGCHAAVADDLVRAG
ncbi:MAG TPA: acetamidase/formamidase family protein [Ilumatobacter sp.]|nr:acetamidase/formamidase family protein [Ilumatobacter sp.]